MKNKLYIISCSDGMVYDNLKYKTREGAEKKAKDLQGKDRRKVFYRAILN